MRQLETISTIGVLGLLAYVAYRMQKTVIPDVVGFIDGVAGTAIRDIVVPEGPNTIAVEYWKDHGIDPAWFMEIARGQQEIPALIKQILPDTVTVGMLYNAYFNWALGTTIGDLESWVKIGLPGSSDALISNLYQYADATLWRIDTLESIYNSLQEENLWDVIL